MGYTPWNPGGSTCSQGNRWVIPVGNKIEIEGRGWQKNLAFNMFSQSHVNNKRQSTKSMLRSLNSITLRATAKLSTNSTAMLDFYLPDWSQTVLNGPRLFFKFFAKTDSASLACCQIGPAKTGEKNNICLWVKNRYPKWNPGKWKHGPKPAVPWWFNFDPPY